MSAKAQPELTVRELAALVDELRMERENRGRDSEIGTLCDRAARALLELGHNAIDGRFQWRMR